MNTQEENKLKQHVDIDLVLMNFHDRFRADPLEAAERLHDLLIDPVTCDARCSALAAVREHPQRQKAEPAGVLGEGKDYVRELIWLATDQLIPAIESGQAEPRFLAQLASRPVLLSLASRAVVDGKEALADIVKVHQVETWHWLREQVESGNLQRHRHDQVVGKHVAAWKKEQPYSELVVGDSPDAVRAAACKRWFLPDDLIAETFVDET